MGMATANAKELFLKQVASVKMASQVTNVTARQVMTNVGML